jgi:hypothetical protein
MDIFLGIFSEFSSFLVKICKSTGDIEKLWILYDEQKVDLILIIYVSYLNNIQNLEWSVLDIVFFFENFFLDFETEPLDEFSQLSSVILI